MPLFPATLAYVIVVQRAMDVSVVVRQGLQYALAKNTAAVLQILLPIVALVAIVPFIGQLSLLWQIPIFIALIGLTFLFTKSSERFKLWIDRRFFREAYNAEQILSDLSEDVRMMVETKPLLETVSHRISESLHVPQVALLLKNGDGFHPAYALGINLIAAPQKLGGAKYVAYLHLRGLDLPRLTATLAIGAEVEAECRQPLGGKLARVTVGHLLANASPRAGADHAG